MEDWKPMESAPRDGTWVLIRGDDDREPDLRQWRRFQRGSSNPEFIEDWIDQNACRRPSLKPTGWKPAPPPHA
jgi:hypothetical protein